ncbi:tRNA (N6-isopentenyl adenosine(37)-C2)-methylthiotransferase MiaB [Actinospica durhamensis]|uniref:tRNA (N6-isopentenyl adenosine(37)-C2)-methylthiotransferase MiaB n=1 Tax=Actinospica durhamensis TaxID=1508375 RepID=UPI001FEBCB84|nr:tRNA (N6-isopentenyl adenosine(37)-C2)-methylthiotransferase MiaB [Actinospica durhamensis]
MAQQEDVKSYDIRTYGCQMNVHDSERLAGLMEAAGYVRTEPGTEADVVVFNTCAVRENADNRLYGNLGHLASVKARKPGMQIAVGGCLAQKDRGEVQRRAPWVDVVFGTHNIGSLPALLERARVQEEAQLEIKESLEAFPSTLPTRRESAYAAWVSVSVGCNNTCTFCIVPALRGTEKDRRPGDILREIEALVAEGVVEVTLLGQNVNSYGAEFGDRQAFSKLLRSCGGIDGLERVRFTSPHPRDFTDDVIEAMAQTPNVMPSLHMPLQSGSDTVLRAMRRSYRRDRYLGIIERVREAIPHAAITTDVIVGFPGETDEDFEQTLEVVREARFASAFTFQYSKRPGTPAADMDGQVPKEVVQERYERLAALQEEISWAENRALVGTEVELLVAEGEGRKDGATRRLSGRARDNRLVHFGVGETEQAQLPRPGDAVTVVITQAAPHHLIADGVAAGAVNGAAGAAGAVGHGAAGRTNVADRALNGLAGVAGDAANGAGSGAAISGNGGSVSGGNGGSAIRVLRRLPSGDAWERRQAAPAQDAGKLAVSLGMPSVGVPAPLPTAQSCG